MRKRKVNLKQPLFVGNKPATIAQIFRNGHVSVVRDGDMFVRNFDAYGQSIDPTMRFPLTNEDPITEEVLILYPNGAQYTQDNPVRNSSYGVDQLIQVRVRMQGGRIISKELI